MPIKKPVKAIKLGEFFNIYGQTFKRIDISSAGIHGFYLHMSDWKLVQIDDHIEVEFSEVLITPAPRN